MQRRDRSARLATPRTLKTILRGQRLIQYPVTPDGRYFVVRGRLWRCSDPSLPEDRRQALVNDLMTARRDLRGPSPSPTARSRIQAAKVALGERGPAWWTDGAPDYNRHLIGNTPYASWFAQLDGTPG